MLMESGLGTCQGSGVAARASSMDHDGIVKPGNVRLVNLVAIFVLAGSIQGPIGVKVEL